MKQNKSNNRVVEKIVGVVVLLVAFGAVAVGAYFYLESQQTKNWMAVEGVITKSDTRIQRSPGSRGTPTTIADVRYKFVVGGIEYHNDTISLAQYGSSSASHAVQEAHRYPVGSKVMVYYDPDDPRDAVLERKTPWVFIGIFSGLGALLIYIGIAMLGGGFHRGPSATVPWHDYRPSIHAQKAPAAKGKRLVAVLFASALMTGLCFYLYFNKNAEHYPGSRQMADHPLERGTPRPVSIYSEKENLQPCNAQLKAQVAQRQRIQLDDGMFTLYVTATLCIDEQEMKIAPQAQRTWPTIAQQLASYDRVAFDPESDPSASDGENASPGFRFRLEQIEQACIERLHENDIFFVKAIRFESLKVFQAD